MKKERLTGVALGVVWALLLVLVLQLAGCAPTTNVPVEEGPLDKRDYPIHFSAGPEGSLYYKMAQAVGTIVQNQAGYEVFLSTSTGSKENLDRFLNQEANMALVPSSLAFLAYMELGDYEDWPNDPHQVCHLMGLYPEYLQVVVRADSDCRSINDLKGQTVAVGVQNSATEQATRTVLAGHQLSYADLTVDYCEGQAAVDKLLAGEVAALFWLTELPQPVLSELADQVTLLPLTQRALDEVHDYNLALEKAVIPAGTYGNAEQVPTLSSIVLLMLDQDLPDQVALELVEVMLAHLEDLREVSPPATDEVRLLHAGYNLRLPHHEGIQNYYVDLMDEPEFREETMR